MVIAGRANAATFYANGRAALPDLMDVRVPAAGAQRPLVQNERAAMSTFRIALANLRFPSSPDNAVVQAERTIVEAGDAHADIICFPEAFVPGYRAPGRPVPPPDAAWLERAWSTVAGAARQAGVTVVLGTERLVEDRLLISTLVIDRDGTPAGFQDKVQLDPSEEATYSAGVGRRIFRCGALTFGIAICHEGWRYPETVRWAVRHGAQVVFHPHFHEADADSYRPTTFADPANSFHEKAVLCRAAENTCFLATVNCASAGSPTTSAIVGPDGTLRAYQPYGEAGLLVANIELAEATRLLALRCKEPL
jgi:predicted amidohydrolase